MTSPVLATMTFNENFNSLSLWNSTTGTGTWATNFWYADPKGNGGTLSGNGEQQWYINAEYAPTASVKPWTVDNGVLTLTAAPATTAVSQQINGYQYTSGEINTYHSFSQLYGYFEMRAELPAGQGAWPAFWLLPEDGSWPPELDIFEVLGKDPTTLYTTVHTAETGQHTSSGQGTTVADTSVGYHTYGVDWEADKITWYYDGKQVYQVDTPADMHKPMYIMANLAVGGYWGGNVDSTSPPTMQMYIDYIRAYTALPDTLTTPPVETPAPGAPLTLTGNDKTISTLVGGTGADVLTTYHLADTLTGGAGADTFVFKALPWNAGHITDFTVGVDKLDLSALIAASGYKGSDPIADGYLILQSDGQGGTKVMFDIDGKGTANLWPTTVTILDHVSPDGLTAAQLFGTATASTPASSQSPSTSTSTSATALTGNDTAPSTLVGGAGADVLTSYHQADTLTGGAGADTFVFKALPWNAGHITDFTVGVDKLDLSALIAASGYKGSDLVADGYLSFQSDGQGGTKVMFDIDGKGTANPWPITITTLDHVSPTGLTAALLLGTASQTNTLAATASATSTLVSGVTLSGNDTGPSTLTGGAGADILKAGHYADTLTGGAGADTFTFSVLPWNAGHVTDFQVGTDKLDLSALATLSGYHGSDPVADHYLSFRDDGHGNTQVYVDTDGAGAANPWPILVTTLDHVSATSLHSADWIF